MKPPSSPVITHLEKHLGKLRGGWPFDDDKLLIVEFNNRPHKGATTYASLGVSDVPLKQAKGPKIRQELLFVCGRADWEEAADLLSTVALQVRDGGRSLDRGEVVGPSGPIFAGSPFEAFYCAPPVYFPDELAALDGVGGATLVIVWLVPITLAEAKFIEKRGWPAFEDLLEEQDLDLTDLHRPPFKLPKN